MRSACWSWWEGFALSLPTNWGSFFPPFCSIKSIEALSIATGSVEASMPMSSTIFLMSGVLKQSQSLAMEIRKLK